MDGILNSTRRPDWVKGSTRSVRRAVTVVILRGTDKTTFCGPMGECSRMTPRCRFGLFRFRTCTAKPGSVSQANSSTKPSPSHAYRLRIPQGPVECVRDQAQDVG